MISGGCSFAKANWAPGGRSAVLFQLGGSVNRLQKLAPSRRQSQLQFPSRAAMQQNVDSAGSGGRGRIDRFTTQAATISLAERGAMGGWQFIWSCKRNLVPGTKIAQELSTRTESKWKFLKFFHSFFPPFNSNR